ncbi:MAG: hypothetical protein ACYS9X_24555 [Planctomycetota bacterium]|jgi:hypothetical protein
MESNGMESNGMESNTPDAPGRLERALECVRANGLWLLVGLSALASVNVIALVRDPVAAEKAIGISPGDLLLAALAIAAAVEVLVFGRAWKRALPPPAMFGLVAAGALSALAMVLREWGELAGVMGAAREVVQLVEVFVVGYAWVLWAARRRRDIDRALVALAVAVTVNVLLALLQLGGGAHPFHVRGLFANRNFFGVFLAATLPVLVAAASAEGDRPPGVRLWMLSAAAAGLAVMTSGGLFAAAAVGVLVAAFAVGPRAGWAAVAAVAVVALMIQPTGALPGVREAQYRSVALFPEDARGRRAPSERMRRWAAGLECLRDNATFGVGPGRFQTRIERYYLHGLGKGGGNSTDVEAFDVSFDEPGSHGLYEVTACEGGFLGLVALAWFLAAAVARSGRAATRDSSGLAGGALGAAVAVLIAGVFGSVLARGVALPFVVALALGRRAEELRAESQG